MKIYSEECSKTNKTALELTTRQGICFVFYTDKTKYFGLRWAIFLGLEVDIAVYAVPGLLCSGLGAK